MPDIPIPSALAIFAILWFAAGYAARRPRPTDTDAKLTPAQAMAQVRTDVPDETRRLERGHDDTLPAIPAETQQLPAVGDVTGDLGAPERPVSVAEMERPTLAIGAPDPGPQPDPERDAVTLTISHLPPDGDGTTVHGRRFDDIIPGAELPKAVWDTWATVLGLRDAHGGTVHIAIKRDGRYQHFEPDPAHPNDWPRGASQTLKQPHHTPVAVAAVTGPPSETWGGRW